MTRRALYFSLLAWFECVAGRLLRHGAGDGKEARSRRPDCSRPIARRGAASAADRAAGEPDRRAPGPAGAAELPHREHADHGPAAGRAARAIPRRDHRVPRRRHDDRPRARPRRRPNLGGLAAVHPAPLALRGTVCAPSTGGLRRCRRSRDGLLSAGSTPISRVRGGASG